MTGFSWRTRSLRFWLSFGLALAVLPLGISAVGGHVLLSRGVVASFADVAARQRYQLVPAQRLRSTILDAVEPVDDFVDEGDPKETLAYRAMRERIEAAFGELHNRLQDDPEPRAVVERAREEWVSADHLATEILSVRRSAGDLRGAELMDRFHGLVESSVDKLAAVSKDIEDEVARDHDTALLSYERTEWIAGIAAGISGLAIIVAVVVIGRIVSTSVDRLVSGAERFAAGDRTHRIEVQVPPELHSVAEEFNRMIERIHESEGALADLARRDGLTNLPNRRAFDDALRAAFARMARVDRPCTLLMIDVDHFKKINDTYGHGVGDDVLQGVARVMAADPDAADHVFRVGGEEFGVILPDASSAQGRLIAERLRQAIEALRIPGAASTIRVTASFGLSVATAGSDVSTLPAAADAALYRAKQSGRNRVVSDSELEPIKRPA